MSGPAEVVANIGSGSGGGALTPARISVEYVRRDALTVFLQLRNTGNLAATNVRVTSVTNIAPQITPAIVNATLLPATPGNGTVEPGATVGFILTFRNASAANNNIPFSFTVAGSFGGGTFSQAISVP